MGHAFKLRMNDGTLKYAGKYLLCGHEGYVQFRTKHEQSPCRSACSGSRPRGTFPLAPKPPTTTSPSQFPPIPPSLPLHHHHHHQQR